MRTGFFASRIRTPIDTLAGNCSDNIPPGSAVSSRIS
jgi:hypothetical protein